MATEGELVTSRKLCISRVIKLVLGPKESSVGVREDADCRSESVPD